MKRSYRAISLCLLLALVLTAFGIFTSFAAEDSTQAPTDEPAFEDQGKFVYDMDAVSGDKISVTNKDYGPNVVRNEKGYWEMNYDGYDPTTAGSGGDYWNANGSASSIYINNKYTTDNAGNKTVTVAKNTDYLIIDFDISTDSSLLDGIYFHNRWLSNTGGSAQQNYIQLNGTDLDNFYISTHQGGSCIRPSVTPGEWLNVTIVYDFSSVDEEGYAKTSDWVIHVYLDGIWCGNLPSISTSAVNFYFNRVSTDAGAIQNGPDANTQFANFTYKTYPRGYEGPMTESGVLGYTGCTLMDIPELRYTQEDTPYDEDRLIATVERDGESIEVYHLEQIDASLQDGDVVILERSLSTPLIKDSNVSVTFKDKNGTVLTPGTYNRGDLVYVEKPYELDFTSGTVIRRTNDNPRKKNVTNNAVYFPCSVLETYAPIGESSSYRYYTYILLADATYERTGSVANLYGDILETDLNGYTLTLAQAKRFESSTDTKGSYPMLAFRNGTLIHSGTEYTMMNTRSKVVFENISYTQTGSNPLDQRGGMVIYKNVTGTSKMALTNAKGSGVNRSTVIVDGCDITVTSNVVVNVSSVASGGKYQGSMEARVRLSNSKLTSTGSNIVNVDVKANSYGTYGTDAETGAATFAPSSAAQNANDNDLKIYVDNCELSSPAQPAIALDVSEFRAKSGTTYVDAHETFSFDTDIVVTNSDVTAKYLVNQKATGYNSTLKYTDNYTYNTNVKLENSDLYLSGSLEAIVLRQSLLASTALHIDIGAEVSLPTNDESKFIASDGGATTDNYTNSYSAEGVWIRRTLEGAPAYSYSMKLDTHSYIYDGHEYEFTSYLGDPITAENIPQELPAESSLLKYEWHYNIDGAWEAMVTYKGDIKANVTAASDLALNIYLPATFGDEAYDSVYAEGRKVVVSDITVDGVDYKVVTIPGIDPSSALKDFTIKFRAVDENGASATVECEISVLDYIDNALKSETLSDEGKALVASLLNYIAKAAAYNNPTAELDPALTALLESDEYLAIDLGTPTAGEAKDSVKELGVFSSVRLALDTRFAYEFLVKDGFSGEITLSYLVGGTTETKTLSVEGGDIVRVELLTYEVGTPITVTYGEASGEINLDGYLALIDSPSAELAALAEAIAIYAEKAIAYMN